MLNVIMLNAVMPVAVLSVLIVSMLSVNILSVVILCVVQRIVYADCSIYYCYDPCHNAERCYAECSAECGLS